MQAELWPTDLAHEPDPGADRRSGQPSGEEEEPAGPVVRHAPSGLNPTPAHSPIHIELCPHQMEEAERIGRARNGVAVAGSLRHTRQRARGGGDLERDIVGAAGEVAVRDWLGLDVELSMHSWAARSDLPGEIDVRATAYTDGRLIVERDHIEHRAIVLVCGRPPLVAIRGWLHARDGKRAAWLANPGHREPAFFVPTVELHAMATLPRPSAREIERWIHAEREAERRWRTSTKRG